MTTSSASTRQLVPDRVVLSNGIVLLVAHNPTVDVVAARFLLRAGSLFETSATAGLTSLLAAVLTKGTLQHSSFEIAEQIEYAGAGLGTDATTDYFWVSLKSVVQDFPQLLTLVAELIQQPSFPEAELELERRLHLQAIRSQQERPLSIAFDLMREALYSEHPYAFPSLGTQESITQLTQVHLQRFHQQYFRPDNLVISIAGNLTLATAQQQVEAAFGRWTVEPDSSQLPVELELPGIQPSGQQHTQVQDTQQAIVMLGYLAPSVHRDDYAAVKLLATYLGNGMSSRLFVELREKRGLAYDVSVIFPTRLETAPFVTYMGTAPQNTAIAIEGLRHEVERLSDHQLTASELQTTKTKLLGQYALGKQTNAQIAQIFGWYEILGLGLAFDLNFQTAIQAVTAEDLQHAAAQYCQTPTLAVVGPQAAMDLL
ncbi:MAG: pitrilysin family protein [Cyanobacteria bacterium P01_H01_bin.121]